MTEELLLHERPDRIHTPCDCASNRTRTVYCEDCTFAEPLCPECFIIEHKRNPFHWGHLWRKGANYGERVDISLLRSGGFAVPMGHNGERCPFIPSSNITNVDDLDDDRPPKKMHKGIGYTVMAPNGIHGTVLEFSECPSAPDRLTQLMRAKLFPATADRPITAFTFPTMRNYRALSFRTKCSGHDYVKAMQRLSDPVRPSSLSVQSRFHSSRIST